MNQIEMVSLNELVPSNHQYRKFLSLWNFTDANKELKSLESDNNYKGYGLLRLLKCSLLQFMEDLSDRELARYLQENNSAKWFCGFGLVEATPEYSLFSKFRNKLGTNKLSSIFNNLQSQLKNHGYITESLSFIDASHLISKANLWEERDKAIKAKHDKLNNEVLPKVAHDKQARIGCKGKNKYWYGYKKHVCVDIQSGLINKVAITPANIPDSKGLKHVCPGSGIIYADKGYCSKEASNLATKKGSILSAIKKNNMKDKNHAEDKVISKKRSPYERVFSKQRRRVRYIGISKNQYAEFMYAICFNLRRLVVLSPSDLRLT